MTVVAVALIDAFLGGHSSVIDLRTHKPAQGKGPTEGAKRSVPDARMVDIDPLEIGRTMMLIGLHMVALT